MLNFIGLTVKTFHSLFVQHLSMVYLALVIISGDVIFHLQLAQDVKIHHLCVKFSNKHLS